ncbi:proton-dependent oligopeptide transporter, POT family [Flavimobilis marinus]|uniref:Proton-dependent oligopeptide transporter, POT family n=1 Tax=Flavimobilis marinus TaxID=285351 RepID=A0A1I2CIW6_9MICO|nr:oligopeptide:H+ symporter [Flavimobilis marinus]SFE67660.1 proton-dependent oligopeptide transporter, POT family [Flavimobilis marinus]
MTVHAPEQDRRFFGHPLGLMTLFGTELWERFSYYGMRAILLYYLTDTIANGGLGFDENTGLAVTSIYGASVYLLSVVGGWLADRMIGARRATLYGGIVIALGHVLLAVPGGPAFSFAGIVGVAIGTGLLKPNVSSMVGELYTRGDDRRDAGFSIFYMGINIGSLAAPFLVGIAREVGGYHAGFLVAAVGMALALTAFVLGRRQLAGAGEDVENPITPEDHPALVRGGLAILALIALMGLISLAVTSTQAGGLSFGADGVVNMISYLAFAAPVLYFTVMLRSPKVTRPERSRVVAYIPLFVAAMLFWMIFEQAASSLSAFAKSRTELEAFGTTISPEFFQSVNPASIIILAPVFAYAWVRFGERGPSTAVKFGTGLALAASSFLFLSFMTAQAGEDLVPAWVLVVTYVIQTLGELFLSPVGLAATTLLAPRAFRSQAMALWFLAPSAGQAITAQIVSATEDLSNNFAAYFGWIGGITLLIAGAFFLLAPWITRKIREGEEVEEAVEPGAGEPSI